MSDYACPRESIDGSERRGVQGANGWRSHGDMVARCCCCRGVVVTPTTTGGVGIVITTVSSPAIAVACSVGHLREVGQLVIPNVLSCPPSAKVDECEDQHRSSDEPNGNRYASNSPRIRCKPRRFPSGRRLSNDLSDLMGQPIGIRRDIRAGDRKISCARDGEALRLGCGRREGGERVRGGGGG